MSEQKLTFKTLTTKPTANPEHCPYVGVVPFEGAIYVRRCTLLPDLCSCTYWQSTEVYAKCWTRQQAENLKY